MSETLTNVVGGFPVSGYYSGGITLTQNAIYISDTLEYVGYTDDGVVGLAKKIARRESKNAANSAKVRLSFKTAARRLTVFDIALDVATNALTAYYEIQMAIELYNAKKLFREDFNLFEYICKVDDRNIKVKARYNLTGSNFSVDSIILTMGNTNENLTIENSGRRNTTVKCKASTVLMIWGTEIPDEDTMDYTDLAPTWWNQFDQFVVVELTINFSDLYHGDLVKIPYCGSVKASNYTLISSKSVTAEIVDIFYDDATTITIDILAGDDEFEVNNLSYYVGKLTDSYQTSTVDATGLLFPGEVYVGSRDIDVAGYEYFTNPSAHDFFDRYLHFPFYFYNTIDVKLKRYKVKMSTFFNETTTTITQPGNVTTSTNNYFEGNNVSSLTFRPDMTQFMLQRPLKMPSGIVGVVLTNLLAVSDTLQYRENNVYRLTLSNITAPVNFKYGFNKLLDESVDKPSIVLAPMTVQTPTATYIINAPGTTMPSIQITLSNKFPTGVTGHNIGNQFQVWKEGTDITAGITPTIVGSVYTFENMDATVEYTFKFVAWAKLSSGQVLNAAPVVVGPYTLKTLLIPTFTNTTFKAANGRVIINSVVPKYYGLDHYILTIGNESPQIIDFTDAALDVQASGAVPPIQCTLQTSFNGIVSNALPIIYPIGATQLLALANWWATGALYKVDPATCAQLAYLDNSRVLSIQINDVGDNITNAFNKNKLGICYAKTGSTISATNSNLKLRCAMAINDTFLGLVNQSTFTVSDSAANIIAQLSRLTKPSFLDIYATTTMVLDAAKYLANSIAVSKFSQPFQITVDANTIKQIVPSALISWRLSDTAPRIKSLDLSLYTNIVSIAVVANNAYDANLTYSWDSFKMGVLNAYVTPFMVTNVPLAQADIIKTNSNATVTILDTADNYKTILGRLSFSRVQSISLQGSLTLTYTQFQERATCSLITTQFSVTETTVLNYEQNPSLSAISKAAVTIQDSVEKVTLFLKSIIDYKNITFIYATGLITMPFTQFSTTQLIVESGYAVTNAPFSFVSALEAHRLVNTYTVLDSSFNINVELGTLMTSSKVTAISCTNSLFLNYTSNMRETFYRKFTRCATVANVGVGSLATVCGWFNINSPTTVGIVDTSTALTESFSSILSNSRVSSVTLTDTGSVSVTAAVFINYQTKLASVSVAASFFQIVELENTTQLLDAFTANLYFIKSIQLGVISIPYSTYLNKTLLAKLQTSYKVTGAPCSALSTLFSLQACQGVGVTDSAVNILKYLSVLQTNVSKIISVTSSSGSINPTISQYLNPDASSSSNTIYLKMTNFLSPADIPCSTLASYISLGKLVSVSDSSAAILKNIAALNSADSYVLTISALSTLALTYNQTVAYPLVLAKIRTAYTVSGSGDDINSFAITKTRITGISVTSGSLNASSFTAFASILSGRVSIVDTKEAISSAMLLMNTNASLISTITSTSSALLQFDSSVTTSYANLVPRFANFAIDDTYEKLFSKLSIFIKSNVSSVKITDSVTIQQFSNISGLPLQSVDIMDTATAVQTWLQAVPPNSVASIKTNNGSALLFFGSTYNNAALMQSTFKVSNVPCASIATTLANTKVSGIYVVDTKIKLAAYKSVLSANSLKIIDTVASEGGSSIMKVSQFLTYAAGSPTYAVAIVDAPTEISDNMVSLVTNNLFIQSVTAETGAIDLSVASLQTYVSVVLKMTAFTVTDDAATIQTNLSLLNLYPITAIFISGSGTITLAVSQLCPIVAKLQSFILSDTAVNLQGLAVLKFSPYEAVCTAINATSGSVTLSYAQVGAFVAKMSVDSVVISDTAANIVSFMALSPYTSKILSTIILGTITLDFGVYDAAASAKFTNYVVNNVPASSVSAVLARASSITVADSATALANAMSTLASNVSRITRVTITDGSVINLTVTDFVSYPVVLLKVVGLNSIGISGTSAEITASLNVIKANDLKIKSIEVPLFSLTYSNFLTYSSIVSKFTTPFTVTEVPLAQAKTVYDNLKVVSIEVKDTLTNLSKMIDDSIISQLDLSKITNLRITKDMIKVVSFGVYTQYNAVFTLISLS